MRYTDEEMSRILSAHANGKLRRGGRDWDRYEESDSHSSWGKECDEGCGCVNQFAYNVDDRFSALPRNHRPGTWFDREYVYAMTPEELMNGLDSATEEP